MEDPEIYVDLELSVKAVRDAMREHDATFEIERWCAVCAAPGPSELCETCAKAVMMAEWGIA